jgi:hypothetical protein
MHPHALEQQVLSHTTQLDTVDALQVLQTDGRRGGQCVDEGC